MSLKKKLVSGTSGQHQSSSPMPGYKANVNSDGEQNEGGWFERADHPLLNDLVLPMILYYLRGNDSKSCRLVNKKWNFSTLPFMRSRLQVNISWSRSHVEAETSIKKFMKLMNSNTLGNPFGRYYLGSFDATTGCGQQFVQLCGNTTNELILSDIFHSCKVESISEMLRSMPQLESFTMATRISHEGGSAVQLFPGTKPELSFLRVLIVEREDADETRKICPTFYEELLGAAPNISTLQLLTDYPNRKDAQLEVFGTLEKLGRFNAIENLRLPQIDSDILKFLRNMTSKGMKLKKLNFHARTPEWLELVTLFKDSLVSLSISEISTTRISIFPTMPKLTSLHLTMLRNMNLSCENFARTFPSLQKLQFHFTTLADNSRMNNFITGDPSTVMKSLIFEDKPKMNMEVFNRILTVFPVLTRLDCRVTEEDGADIIKKIWTHMKQLLGLHIRGTFASSENLNSLITGIPVQEIKNIPPITFIRTLRQTKTKIHRENILKRMMMDKNHELPSIQNLTNLRSLTLDLTSKRSGVHKRNYLTEFTAYFGLRSVKTLRHLCVSECEFSERCCEILVEDMDLMTWGFRSRFTDLDQIIPQRLSHNDEFVYQ